MIKMESSLFENLSCINGVNTTNIDNPSNISTIYMYPPGTYPIRNGINDDIFLLLNFLFILSYI